APAPPGAVKRGGTVVAGPTVPAPRANARAEFDKRLAGLPRASARAAFDPQALLRGRAPEALSTAWGRSLRDGAAVLVIRGERVVAPFKVSGAPVKPGDLPVAPGTTVPSMRGSAPIVAAVRDPAQTLAFLRAAGLLPALDILDRAPGFLKPDLGDLGPD